MNLVPFLAREREEYVPKRRATSSASSSEPKHNLDADSHSVFPGRGGVQECAEADGDLGHRDSQNRLVHTFKGVLAINADWRVQFDDPIQWRLQRRRGDHRWEDRYFCRTRDGLLRCIHEHCSEVGSSALAKLEALPEQHIDLDEGGRL